MKHSQLIVEKKEEKKNKIRYEKVCVFFCSPFSLIIVLVETRTKVTNKRNRENYMYAKSLIVIFKFFKRIAYIHTHQKKSNQNKTKVKKYEREKISVRAQNSTGALKI